MNIVDKIKKKIKETSLLFVIWLALKKITYIILYSLFRLLPLKSKIIVFASERDYCDNSWALYQYIHSKYSNYQFVWVTLKRKKYNNDKRTKFIYHPYSFTLLSAWYIARAKYIFYTHGLGNDLKIRKNQMVMNLWHGIAIKGTKCETLSSTPPFTHLIYLGEMNKKAQAQFLSCDEKYLVPLGYPRNDILLNNRDKGYNNPFVPKGFNGKVVIWMPTYRKSPNKFLSEDNCETNTGLPLFDSVHALKQLDDFLESINVFVITKIHHLQALNDVFQLKFKNIIFVTDDNLVDKGLQLYQILGKSDALLTDYSSVSIDYLLVDKPMGFIIDDLEEYEKGRGKFQFENVKEVLAGIHIYNIKELHSFLIEISKNIDSTRSMREKIIGSMITYQDNESCERICRFCGI